MSNETGWKIAGGIGLTPDPVRAGQQVMLQGIGFPLRPVDNVPNEVFPVIPNEIVAQGLFMQFMTNGFEQGLYYPKGSTLTNGVWTMVSNVLTNEYPYPEPDGNPEYSIPTFTPVTQNNSSVVYSGNQWTLTESVWVQEVRVWVTELTANTNYRIITVIQTPDGEPVTSIIDNPVLVEGAWKIIALMNRLLPTGTTILVYIDGLNSGGTTPVVGGWTYAGLNNNAAPALQSWNVRSEQNLLRIDKTDLDGTDRTTELLGMVAGTIIQFAQTNDTGLFAEYRVSLDPTDQGTFISYVVTLEQSGGGGPAVGQTTSMTAEVPIPQPTEYAEQAAIKPTPSWGTAEGFLQYNGVDQGGDSNTYGTDIQCEPAVIPSNWEILSYTPLT